MSYPDTLSRLAGQVRQLEDARMEESRERDRLRCQLNQLRKALEEIRSLDGSGPLLTDQGRWWGAKAIADAALSG